MFTPSPPPPCVDERLWPENSYRNKSDKRMIRSSEIHGSYPSAKDLLISKLKKEYVANFKLGRLRCGRASARSSISFVRSRVHPAAAFVATPRTVTTVARTLEQRFQEQAEKWERETAHLSSPLQKMENPSYQAIMGMSAESPEHKRALIRFMLRDLRNNHRDWFLALSYLTQYNPIRQKDYGKPSKMIESWVKWGQSQGLL